MIELVGILREAEMIWLAQELEDLGEELRFEEARKHVVMRLEDSVEALNYALGHARELELPTSGPPELGIDVSASTLASGEGAEAPLRPTGEHAPDVVVIDQRLIDDMYGAVDELKEALSVRDEEAQ